MSTLPADGHPPAFVLLGWHNVCLEAVAKAASAARDTALGITTLLWDGAGGASVVCCSLLVVKSCVPRLSGAQSPLGWVILCLPSLLSLDWEHHILGTASLCQHLPLAPRGWRSHAEKDRISQMWPVKGWAALC